jgi:hypothetical protein
MIAWLKRRRAQANRAPFSELELERLKVEVQASLRRAQRTRRAARRSLKPAPFGEVEW